jgi:hypothetical protein
MYYHELVQVYYCTDAKDSSKCTIASAKYVQMYYALNCLVLQVQRLTLDTQRSGPGSIARKLPRCGPDRMGSHQVRLGAVTAPPAVVAVLLRVVTILV